MMQIIFSFIYHRFTPHFLKQYSHPPLVLSTQMNSSYNLASNSPGREGGGDFAVKHLAISPLAPTSSLKPFDTTMYSILSLWFLVSLFS